MNNNNLRFKFKFKIVWLLLCLILSNSDLMNLPCLLLIKINLPDSESELDRFVRESCTYPIYNNLDSIYLN